MMRAADRLAHAIALAVDEHGTPNRFAPGELARAYNAPPPAVIGRVLRDPRRRASVAETLARWGFTLGVYEPPEQTGGPAWVSVS